MEDPLEKEMTTHSNISAWETHGQRSLVEKVHGVARVRHDLVTQPPTIGWRRIEWQPVRARILKYNIRLIEF